MVSRRIDPPLFPIKVGGRGCYINAKGAIVLETDHQRAGWFYCNRAPVWNGTSYGFINSEGSLVIEHAYSDVLSFSEDVCGVAVGGKWGVVDKWGNWLIRPQYDEIGRCASGRVGVSSRRGFDVSYVDLHNKVIIQDIGLRALSEFSEGLLGAEDSSLQLYGFRNLDGEWAIAPSYSSVGEFSEGLAEVKRPVGEQELTGFIDKNDSLVIPIEHLTAHSPFSCGLAVACKRVRRKELWGALNRVGQWVIEAQYSYLQGFEDGLSMFRAADDSMGFVDTQGNVAFRCSWKAVVRPFTYGVALVRDDKDWYYIDRQGKVLAKHAQ